ncbi:hypothetical protein DXV75_00035 [Alteromonas aestuariivivens]|uniref:Uncharacterized protein n=1 Tax=Alteromonas aestuariivivens TaxID=1938339 RepID=A0A3D8MDH5_9ALTE|nr:hypothetical protein [Alteromonas aestuariivivens]RDV28897.1 hypothetical protein DXV75_00035 [Alteromonas aestuariivivens]
MSQARMSILGHFGLLLFSAAASLLFFAASFIQSNQVFAVTLLSFASLELMLIIRQWLDPGKGSSTR